ncbi:hypothetical protein JCM16303_000507 [Sporobolomyces ruberrimus]
MADRSLFAQASTSSSTPSALPRARIPNLPTSKLVRKARESKYFGGGGHESIHENSPRLSLNNSTTTPDENERDHDQEDGWYKTHYPTSGLEAQPYSKTLPYFLSYANSALDRDAGLTSALEGCVAFSEANARSDSEGKPVLPTPPRKVLDVGCGAGHWILSQAVAKGWEETHFVGLDAEPSRFCDDILPDPIRGRISHVQHDFLLDRLPFDDNSFDFVRIARLNFAVPETKWSELLDECIRVLVPGSYIEIAEVDFNIYSGDGRVQKIFDSILDHQFINSRPLTVVPSTLTLVARDLRSTGRIATRLPSKRLPSDHTPLETESFLTTELRPLGKFAAGSEPILVTPSTTFTSQLALHGYAQWLASSSWGIANAALAAREATGRPPSNELDHERSMRREKELGELEDTIETWADDLRERAGLAHAVTARFGWEPTFDKKLAQQLTDNLPILQERLSAYGRERTKRDSLFGGQQDPEVEFRYQQVDLARRECEHELKAVNRRLGRGEQVGGEEVEDLGSMDLEIFVARAP